MAAHAETPTIQTITVRPGDVLVLRVPPGYATDAVEEFFATVLAAVRDRGVTIVTLPSDVGLHQLDDAMMAEGGWVRRRRVLH